MPTFRKKLTLVALPVLAFSAIALVSGPLHSETKPSDAIAKPFASEQFMNAARSTAQRLSDNGVETVAQIEGETLEYWEPYCDAREAVAQTLTGKYNEHPTGFGSKSQDAILEFWNADKTGSWTILVTTPDGISCVMASGTNWNSGTFAANDIPG